MINKISFTGRETLLTQPMKNAKEIDFVSYAKVYSKEEIAKMKSKAKEVKMPKAEEVEYTSPFAPIKKEAASVDDFVPETMPHNFDTIA